MADPSTEAVEQPQAAVADHPTPDQPPDGNSRGKRIRQGLVIALTLVFCTLTSAGISTLLQSDFGEPAPRVRTTDNEKRPAVAKPKEPHDLFEQIDHLIVAGNYPKAARLASAATEAPDRVTRDSALYRLGLCQEATSQFDEATKTYSRLASDTKLMRFVLLAQFGRLRSLVGAGQYPQALNEAAQLLLQMDDTCLIGMDLTGDVLHWRGMIQLFEIADSEPEAVSFSTRAVLRTPFQTPMAMYLDWDHSLVELYGNEPLQDQYDALIVCPGKSDFLSSRVSMQHAAKPGAALVRDVTGAFQTKLHLTPVAERRLAARTFRLAFAEMSVNELLTHVAFVCDLGWQFHGDYLEISEQLHEPFDSPERRNLLCRQALERAIQYAPEHPMTPYAHTEMARLLVERNLFADAVHQYELALMDLRDDAAVRRLEFNLGLMHLNLGARIRARDMFMNVVDRNPTDELAGMGWWFSARTFLDAGDFAKAMRPLRYAAASSSIQVQTAATLGIATAHLMCRADTEAHRTLGDGPRSMLRSALFRSDAAFLDALARHRLARRDRGKTTDESEDLLWSLLTTQTEPIIGVSSLYLRGLAYEELGFESEMVALFENSLPTVMGPLAVQMASEVAKYYQRNGQLDTAREWYLSLEASASDSVAAWAGLQLADLALRAGKPNECIERCRNLVNARDLQQEQVLRLLGRGYESKGDYRRAVECFSGKVPKP